MAYHKVAVHIVTHNHGDLIDKSLEVLSKQAGDWCVQIIDNASTDDTCERVEKWGFPLLRNEENVGYSAAHNLAITKTQSDYVLTMNPDVLLQDNYILNMTKALDNAPEDVGMAAGRLLRIDDFCDDPEVLDGAGLYLHRNRRQGLRAEGTPLEDYPKDSVYVFGADGAAAFYRRKMLDDICLENNEVFDTSFFLHKEDIDLCWRACWRGWKAIYVPDAIARHIRTFRPGHRKAISPEMKKIALRNRYVLMIKHDQPGWLLRDLPRILFYEAKIWTYVILFERYSLRALVELWQNWRVWINKRQKIQQTKTVKNSDLIIWFNAQEYPIEE